MMKKLNLVCCVVAMSSMAYVWAQTPALRHYQYPGPKDDTRDWYMYHVPETSLAVLANFSDVIAKGTVLSQNWQDMVVRVDHAFVGCTNNQTVVIRKLENVLNLDFPEFTYEGRFPTNSSQIVFSGRANNDFIDHQFKDLVSVSSTPTEASIYRLPLDRRSWWYMDRDDGVLYTQFTNVLQVVRIEPNWTNYYHVLRDGLSSTSDRVREDSFNDLWRLIAVSRGWKWQTEIIKPDPLIWPELKEIYNLYEKIPYKDEPTLPPDL